uniref:Uncharacterized protein n=1 Tax=Abalone asfa-like virus TaxID=2839893 RepID=A0A5K7XX56_9VIRU|nr:hypothetical protein [Abalone asfa-like virus]BCY04547.1 hypothetical protein [Abalone asfa-like virus]
MSKLVVFLFAVIIVLVLICILQIYHLYTQNINNLTGIWLTDEEFKNAANISTGFLYIKDIGPKSLTGYLLIINSENKEIINQQCNINFKGVGWAPTHCSKIEIFPAPSSFPSSLQFKYHQKANMITLSEDGEIYCRFFKNTVLSAFHL